MQQHSILTGNLNDQTGQTLLGILIALCILALPITSGIKMQIDGMKGMQTSGSQTAALLHAQAMVERMLSNKSALENNQYNHSIGYEPAGISDCNTMPCEANQLAQFDISWFQTQLPEQLMMVKANVESDPMDAQKWWVTLYWDQDGSGSTEMDCPAKDDKDLDCIQLPVEL